MTASGHSMTAGVLAGGAGRRLGGIDKGWYAIDGVPLIARTLERIALPGGRVIVSANREQARYRALGVTVVGDREPIGVGPLAGILSILEAASAAHVLIVPVDTPALPLDLADRLCAAMSGPVDLAVARTPAGGQPLHAMIRTELAAHLAAALAAGVRRVTDWQQTLRCAHVDWPQTSAFANINTPDDARAFAARMRRL